MAAAVPLERDQAVLNQRLLDAVKASNLPGVEAALAAGADVNAKNELGYFPLYEATMLGYRHRYCDAIA